MSDNRHKLHDEMRFLAYLIIWTEKKKRELTDAIRYRCDKSLFRQNLLTVNAVNDRYTSKPKSDSNHIVQIR